MLGEVLALQNAAWMAAALFTGAVIVSGKIYGKKEMESRAVLVTVLLFSVLCGFGQMEMEKQWAEDCIGLGLDGEKVWIEGTAENLEEGTGQDGKGIRITLSGSRMAGKPAAVLLGRVDVFFDSISGDIPEVGRKVQVYGEMKKYEAAKNPGEFDFQTYYLGLHSCYGMYGEKGKENILVMGMEKPVKYFLFRGRSLPAFKENRGRLWYFGRGWSGFAYPLWHNDRSFFFLLPCYYDDGHIFSGGIYGENL